MKKAGKILGILLLVLIAAAVTITGCHNARHDKKMMKQGRGYGMNQMEQYRHQMPMNNMRRGRGQGMKPGMRRGQGQGMQSGRGRGMGPGMGAGMRRGGGQGMGAGMTPSDIGQVGPAGIFIDKIPNVTDKQKKEYADLLQKQKDEMAKMRADMAAKIKSTLESQRSKMLNLFTSEQKKYIGSK